MRVFGTILAGGRGTRMGGADKALLMLAGAPLVVHAIRRLSPQVDRLCVNANGDPARLAGFGVAVVPDPLPDCPGPLAGVLAGMLWAEALGADALATVAVDTPFFPHDLVARLAPAGIAADGCGVHPTCALWPISVRAALQAALAQGNRRVADFARASGLAPVVFPGTGAFFNINGPEDLAAAQARAA